MKLPKEIDILSTKYKIEYLDNTLDVDPDHREPMFGNIDFWSRTIRIYKKDLQTVDVFKTLIHEIIHAVIEAARISEISELEKYEDITDLLTVLLTDTFLRNKFIKLEERSR